MATLLVLAGSILLGSCSTPSQHAPVATHLQESPADLRAIAGLQWADGSPVEGKKLDLGTLSKTTKPSDLEKGIDTAEIVAQGNSFIPFGLKNDGTLVGSLAPAKNMDPETFELTAGSRVGELTADGFKPFGNSEDLAAGDGFRQAYAGNLSDRYFVWAETESTSFFESNWRIFKYDFETQESALLSRSEEFSPTEQLPIFGDDTKPILKDDFVYWHTSFQKEGTENFMTGAFSMPVDGSVRPKLLAVDAILPVALDAGIVVTNTSTAPVDGTLDDSAGTRPIFSGVSIVSDSGVVEQLISVTPSAVNPEFATPATGANNHIILSYDAQTLIVNVSSKDIVAFDEPLGADLTSVQQCGNVSTWAYRNRDTGESSGQFFYDNETGELSQMLFDDLYGMSLCNGDWFATSELKETESFAAWIAYNLREN